MSLDCVGASEHLSESCPCGCPTYTLLAQSHTEQSMPQTYISKLFLSYEDAVAVALHLITSKVAIQYERLPGGQLRITIDQNGTALLDGKSAPSYVYVQEGGSMTELYLHEHQTEMGALVGRANCASAGAYRTGAIVEIPPCLRSLGNVFYATAEALVGTVPGLTLYGDLAEADDDPASI